MFAGEFPVYSEHNAQIMSTKFANIRLMYTDISDIDTSFICNNGITSRGSGPRLIRSISGSTGSGGGAGLELIGVFVGFTDGSTFESECRGEVRVEVVSIFDVRTGVTAIGVVGGALSLLGAHSTERSLRFLTGANSTVINFHFANRCRKLS